MHIANFSQVKLKVKLAITSNIAFALRLDIREVEDLIIHHKNFCHLARWQK